MDEEERRKRPEEDDAGMKTEADVAAAVAEDVDVEDVAAVTDCPGSLRRVKATWTMRILALPHRD